MIKTENKTIGRYNVTVTQFPALGPRGSLMFGARVAKIAAPALAKVFMSSGGEVELAGKKISLSAIADAISTLATSVEPESFATLIRDLLRNTQVGRDGQIYDLSIDSRVDEAFESDVQGIYQVVAFVFQVNNFFGLAGIGNLAGIKRSQAIASEPPKAT